MPYFKPFINNVPLNNFSSVALNAAIGSTNCSAQNGQYLFFGHNSNLISRIDLNGNVKLFTLPGASQTVFGLGFIGSRLYAHKTTIGVYYSDDFGETWTQNVTPNILVGNQGGEFISTPDGGLMHVVISLNVVQKTTDGLNWSVGVGRGNGATLTPQQGGFTLAPFAGNPLYSLGGNSSQIWFNKSNDFGTTWIPDVRALGTTNNSCSTIRTTFIRDDDTFLIGGVSLDGSNGAIGIIESEAVNTKVTSVFERCGTSGQPLNFQELDGFLYVFTCNGIWKEKSAGNYDFAVCPTGLIENIQGPPNMASANFNGRIFAFNGRNMLSTLRDF